MVVVAMVSSLGGCTGLHEYVHNGFKVGPNYCPPEAPVAEHWIDESDVRVRTESDDLSQWWTVFNDPVLNSLIADAYRQNLTLREAGFRVLGARAQRAFAAGTLFPGNQGSQFANIPNGGMNAVVPVPQQATGSYTHQQTARLSLFGVVELPQAQLDTWSLGLNSNWELDFWGRFRRAVEMSDAKLDASVENYDNVLVTLLGDVADNYVQLRVYQQEIVIALGNAKVQKKILNDAEERRKAGVATALDVDQATATLAQIEAQIPLFERLGRRAANRLCILLGMPPQDLSSRVGEGPIPSATSEVAIGIPAELLARRPDIRLAEREAAAQAQMIGIAQADFYPYIGITGAMGYQANQFPDLFDSRAFNGSFGPTFRWNLLNYGRTLNNVRLQDAEFKRLVVAYQRKVLEAGEEVENGLIDFMRGQERVKKLDIGVKALENAVELVVEKYNRGAVDYTPVALITQDLIRQQDALLLARGETVRALIQVYKALGGGWQIRLESMDTLPVAFAPTPAGPAEELPTPDDEDPRPLVVPEAPPVKSQPDAAPKP
jgi:NodT family efflux transporter outer membrane factor (OMF) lipoprotein